MGMSSPDQPPPFPLPEPASGRGARRPLAVWLAGRIGWDAYATLAERLAWEVSEPDGRPPTLLLCELEPAITIGRLGSRADVLLSDEELRGHRLDVRFVGRGGGAVLHGPGQVFVAMFAALEDLGLDRHAIGGHLDRFERGLEAAIRMLRCGPARRAGMHGIFGRTGLLAAIGIAVRRGVACHGGFLNVCPALDLFHKVQSAAVAGGPRSPTMTGRTMGSIEAELQRKVRLQDARTALVEQVAAAFGFPRTHIQAGFPHAGTRSAQSRTEFISRVG
jgi:lipoyl(octanoyl) transferase